MAFTVADAAERTVWGNKNVRFIEVTSDGTEANLASGFGVVDTIVGYTPISMTTHPDFKVNKDSSGTSSPGVIGVSSIASGDVFRLTVTGR